MVMGVWKGSIVGCLFDVQESLFLAKVVVSKTALPSFSGGRS